MSEAKEQETREELEQEHARRMVETQKAQEREKALNPTAARVSPGEELTPYDVTEESLAEWENAKKEREIAEAKEHESYVKLSRLPWDK